MFGKKKKSYGITGQVTSTYVPNYLQPMPQGASCLQDRPPPPHVAGAAPSYIPPISHFGTAGLQPPQQGQPMMTPHAGPAVAAVQPPPPLPARPASNPTSPRECGAMPSGPHQPYPSAAGCAAPGLGSSHSAVHPPSHHHPHHQRHSSYNPPPLPVRVAPQQPV